MINILGFLILIEILIHYFYFCVLENVHNQKFTKLLCKLWRQLQCFLMNWMQKNSVFSSYASHDVHPLFFLSYQKINDKLTVSINRKRRIGHLLGSYKLFDNFVLSSLPTWTKVWRWQTARERSHKWIHSSLLDSLVSPVDRLWSAWASHQPLWKAGRYTVT